MRKIKTKVNFLFLIKLLALSNIFVLMKLLYIILSLFSVFINAQIESIPKDSLNSSVDTLKVAETIRQDSITASIDTLKKSNDIDEVTITQLPVQKLNSPISTDVYSQQFFRKNPTANMFEAIAMVNGVKPQLNCAVCNTGDIHINGLEGAYTMILIDGMPIVSSLSTVYGLSGIPNSLIDRIEVTKGPASSIYGSEAMGGVINIITKNALQAPDFATDVMTGNQGEINLDIAKKVFDNKNFSSLLSLNYFYFGNRIDQNKDNFTDTPLQNRISVFNKWNFKRKENRQASFALRYFYEDRFGGEMQWQKRNRGSDDVYGESIYTNRLEFFGIYQLPLKEKFLLQYSYNYHHQDSFYGNTSYLATQKVLFLQMNWEKQLGKHLLKSGTTLKSTFYDDNTPGTANIAGENQPMKSPIYGFYLEDEWEINDKNTLLLGYRYDYHKIHKSVHSPRVAWKFEPNPYHTLRFSFGTGFRVVNLFTEDHAALTGSREVVIADDLKPEKSLNTNLSYLMKIPIKDYFINVDVNGFYSYFNNKIVGDFDSEPDKIIYDNLAGHAISRGVSADISTNWSLPIQLMFGVTYMDVYQENEGDRIQQLHAPKWSGTYNLSYQFANKFSVDLTGQFYGPMRLPTVPDDFRPDYSPWFTLMNIQLTKKFDNGFEIYGGVRNLLNFTPKNPILRPFDPFDNQVDDVSSNPYGYTFDTTYGYAPMQGIRTFLGIRYQIR